MISASTRRSGMTGIVAGFTALGVLVASSGCQSSAPATAPDAHMALRETPEPIDSLPEVTVTLKPTTKAGAEMTGYAWYITTVRDPVGGRYTAAVERRSLTRLWFDAEDDGAQRASIALLLRDGSPTDLILSTEQGHFKCAGSGRDHACTLRVSIDEAAARPVRFAAARHQAATSLHLAGGDDARRLLAAIAKGQRLGIQASFQAEGSPQIEFALNGLSPAIAKLMKRSVAAMPKAVVATPGA